MSYVAILKTFFDYQDKIDNTWHELSCKKLTVCGTALTFDE